MIHSPKHHTELPPAYTPKEMQDMLNKWERVRLLTLKLMKITYKDSWQNPEHKQESHFNWLSLALFLFFFWIWAIVIASISLAFIVK